MDSKSLGKLLVVLREKRGLNQKRVAEELHASASTVCKWEKGDCIPGAEMMKSLAEFYGCTYDDLYHPEATLQRLEEAMDTFQPGDAGTDTETEEVPLTQPETAAVQLDISSFGKHGFKRRLILTMSVAALLACVGVFTLYLTWNNSSEVKILKVVENYAEDEWYGDVYQITYIVNKEPTQEWLLNQLQELKSEYDGYLGTNIIKLNVYDSEIDFLEGQEPVSYNYILSVKPASELAWTETIDGESYSGTLYLMYLSYYQGKTTAIYEGTLYKD